MDQLTDRCQRNVVAEGGGRHAGSLGVAPATEDLVYRRTLSRLAMACVATSLLIAAIGASQAFAGVVPPERATLTIHGVGALALRGFMPGDHVSQEVYIEAHGSVEYVIGLRWAGSRELADHVDVTLLRGSETLHAGPLTEAPSVVSRGSLTDERVALTLVASLRTTAGNQAQSEDTGLTLIVSDASLLEPARPSLGERP